MAEAKDVLARLELSALLSTMEQECLLFAQVLDGKARELAAAGDAEAASTSATLAMVCSFALRHDDGRIPFGPKYVHDGRRSASIEDLTVDQVATLEGVWDQISLPELRARVADVLYVRRRHEKFGRAALKAYLELATLLITPNSWAPASYRCCRAIKIAAGIKSERDVVAAEILATLESRRPDSRFFSARILDALYEARLGDAKTMAALARDGADKARTDKDWDRARQYLQVFARCSMRAGNSAEDERGRMEAAECYVELADEAGSRGVEAGFLERAIQALRELAGTRARVEQLHRRLVVAGQGVAAELSEHVEALNLGSGPDDAREAVTGRPFEHAIYCLTQLWGPLDVGRLRASVLAQVAQSPFFHSIARVVMARDGRVLGRRGSLLSGSAEEREDALRQAMFEQARFRRGAAVAALIQPARETIIEQHYVSPRTLLPLTCASAFVPPGREHVFAEGLAAGFNGDFLTSLCVLMPQVEQAVRMWMAREGVLTSRIDADGVQDVRYLPDLLNSAEANALFGENLVFELRGLLTERFGSNLRNQLAHGLLSDREMDGPESVYFWWLTLLMTCRSAMPDSGDQAPEGPEAEGSPSAEPADGA